MAAYVIAELEVSDPVAYEEYRKGAAASLAAFGGKFLARGGEIAELEGGWSPRRLVIVEFASLARAREWWSSETYREPKALRQRSAKTRMIAIEGVAP
jgi:uncharacterized protein (DUF1330 family)